MKLSLALSTVILSSTAFVSMANAAPTTSGETFQYNPAKLQQVCRGKSAGAPAVLIMNGVIFNGTCEVQYLPNTRSKSMSMDDSMANSAADACAGKSANSSTSVTVDGREMAGKCVLAYRNIVPTGTNQ